jgi:uncharacterized protein YdaU (DUF1376 family)
MNYYSFHVGDYALHTAHLSDYEDLAYRRLIDLYYTTEKPLSLDAGRVARLIRMSDHIQVVSDVLSEFFLKSEDGYINKRCDDEIEKYRAKACRAKDANTKRWASHLKSDMKSDMKSAPNQEPRTNNQEEPKPIEPKPIAPTARFDPKAHLMAKGIDDSLAADWITLRRAKKAPPTEAAISGIEREANKARITLADALSLCCQRGWAGFKSEWALQTPGGGRGATQAQTNKEITARAILGSLLDGFQQPTEKLISQNTGE